MLAGVSLVVVRVMKSFRAEKNLQSLAHFFVSKLIVLVQVIWAVNCSGRKLRHLTGSVHFSLCCTA